MTSGFLHYRALVLKVFFDTSHEAVVFVKAHVFALLVKLHIYTFTAPPVSVIMKAKAVQKLSLCGFLEESFNSFQSHPYFREV